MADIMTKRLIQGVQIYTNTCQEIWHALYIRVCDVLQDVAHYLDNYVHSLLIRLDHLINELMDSDRREHLEVSWFEQLQDTWHQQWSVMWGETNSELSQSGLTGGSTVWSIFYWNTPRTNQWSRLSDWWKSMNWPGIYTYFVLLSYAMQIYKYVSVLPID